MCSALTETLPGKLAERARRDGAAAAVVTDDLTLTWAELASLSFRMSSRLRAEGVAAGDHVALLCGNRAAYLVSWFALANLGAVAVTVNTGLVGDGLRYALTQSKSRLLLIDEALLEGLSSDIEAAGEGLRVLALADDETLFASLESVAADAVYDGHGSDPLIIVYTSGTTGRPKGVLNCHLAYLESGRRMVEALGITRQDRIMVVLPLFHANPQVYAVMSALQCGCCVILRPKFSASRLFDDARTFGATMFTYVGTILAMVAARHPGGDRDHGITRCVGGGCSAQTWRQLRDDFGVAPYELYGMSETAAWASANAVDAYRFGSCGRVRDDLDLAVVDQYDRPVPVGQPGEIVLRPRAPFRLLLEYWDNPAATQAASRNFWFHTGDLGRYDEDGFLYFLGRTKEIIRRGGENISPSELESVILEMPGVKDAAVVGVPDPIMGDEIKACIVAAAPFTMATLREGLAGRVPRFMLPRYLQFVDEIPRTETQKIRRNLLQENDAGVIDAGAK